MAARSGVLAWGPPIEKEPGRLLSIYLAAESDVTKRLSMLTPSSVSKGRREKGKKAVWAGRKSAVLC